MTPPVDRSSGMDGYRQAVVRSDGTVGNIEVLKEAGGDRGFEAAAIEAVLP